MSTALLFGLLLVSIVLVGSQPHSRWLTFFCELKDDDLTTYFTKESLDDLRQLKATVSLAMVNLTDARASIVKQLNSKNISVSAWLLVDKDDGYWANLDNVDVYLRRYGESLDDKAPIGLEEYRIGPVEQFQQGNWTAPLHIGLNRPSTITPIVSEYRKLISEIHKDGFDVESYIIPIILDERVVGTTFLQRLTGLVDLKEVDVTVPMLYSVMMPFGLGMIESYSPEISAIGIGSTGSPASVGSVAKYGKWEEFKRDLLLATSHKIYNIYIYSFEGCIEHGYLKNLKDFNWNESLSTEDAKIVELEGNLVKSLRRVMQGLLMLIDNFSGSIFWFVTHPHVIAFDFSSLVYDAFKYWLNMPAASSYEHDIL